MRSLIPGLLVAAIGVAVAFGVNALLPTVSPLTIGLIIGVLLANIPGIPLERARPGLAFAARRLLRVGIVVLGLRLSIPQIAQLGLPMLAVVVATVLIAFGGTYLLARWFSLPQDTAVLMATGFSICGASAIAAMNGVTKAKESDVVTAVSLVTLFGGLAIIVLPALQGPLSLSDHEFGLWAGASVHDVAQTVATASVAGSVALTAAIVVKLTRVLLLAPMVAIAAVVQRRRAGASDGARTAVVPLFVIGFLIAVAVRSTGWIPQGVLDAAQHLETMLLTAAMVGMGTSVRIGTLIRTAGRAFAVGLLGWVLIAAVAYAGLVVVR